MKKKEFTLVELLAVIVILAIILAIAVPGITRLIESTTKSAFTSDAKKIIKAVENKRLTDENYLPTNLSELNISEANYNNVTFSTIEGKVYIKIIGQNKWEGLTACGTYQNMQAGENVECEEPTGETWLCGDAYIDTRNNKQYATVQIGTQCWFKEDLQYNYNSCLSKTWGDSTGNYIACRSNESSTYPSYSYQWEVAKMACPSGWHLPTDAEWKTLEIYLGMTQAQADAEGWRGTDQGTKLKTSAWSGNNSSGFTALPVGGRDTTDGLLFPVGSGGFWWSSSPSGSNAWSRGLLSFYSTVSRDSVSQANGLSVRCLLGQ
ncbi:MAG: fibrobacter succinogenes major paralogous domain-containing protein [Bacilli bacterium]|nr:fibrobacter succinogenes major paralogous domain-containing protein [Bacilli bacterium]